MPVRSPDMKITMVAFASDLGSQFFQLILSALREAALVTEAAGVQWYDGFNRNSERCHFTILGMEGIYVNGRLANYHAFQSSNRLVWCDYIGLLDLFNLYEKDQLFCTIRIGGFMPCGCTPTTLSHQVCPSSGIHSFGKSAHSRSCIIGGRKLMLTGWPTSGTTSGFDRSLYTFRKKAENWGFYDKYHLADAPAVHDDDFYGAIADLPQQIAKNKDLCSKIEERVTEFLARIEPVMIPVPWSALSVVQYGEDDFTPPLRIESLVDILNEPIRLENMLTLRKVANA